MATPIRSCEVVRLAAPLAAPFHWSTGSAHERRTTLVRVTLESGAEGWGETLAPEAHHALTAAAIADLGLAGAPADLDVSSLSLELQRRGASPKAAFAAAGAFEVACWDARAREQGVPLARLLSPTARSSVSVYASGFYYGSGSTLADEAARYLSGGFTAFKMKIGREPLSADAGRIHEVRSVVGGARLMVDANGAYDGARAREAAAMLVRAGVTWLEEPFPPNDRGAYATLRELALLPIALGESLPFPSLKQVLTDGLADCLQPNVAAAGGIGLTLDLLRDTAEAGLEAALHAWGSPVMTAVSLHVAAAAPGAPIVEFDLTPNPLRELVTDHFPQPTAGELKLTERAGLGLEVDLHRLRWLEERTER